MSIIGPTRPAIIPPIARATGEGGLPWEAEPGGVTWHPSMMPGAFAFYDGMQVALVGSDADVLEDQVATGTPAGDQDLTAPSAGQRPAYSAASANLNGQPSLVFAGVDSVKGATAANWKCLHDGTGMSYAIVFVPTSGAAGAKVVLDTHVTSSANVGTSFYFDASTGVGTYYISAGGGTVAYGPASLGAGLISSGTPYVLVARYVEGGSPTEINVRLNGVQRISANTANAPSAANPAHPLTLGQSAAASLGMTGEIGMAIFASTSWENADVAALEAYAAARYGIALP